MKKTLLAFSLLAWTFSVFGQNDSIVLADYEANSQYPNRTSAWTSSDLLLGVDNPIKDAINPSDKVAGLHIKTQWSDALVLDNFIEPISLALHPNFKLKVLSDSAVSKKIGIDLTDINNYSIYVEYTLPSDINTKWADVVFDLASKVTSTPISFVKKITLRFDYGSSTAVDNAHNKYFVDDIRFTGPAAPVSETDNLTLFQEDFSSNGWWGAQNNPVNTIAYFRTAQWGGSALSALEKYYTTTDSLCMAMYDWGPACAYFFPASQRPGVSQLSLKDINVEGVQNIAVGYKMKWVSAPASWTDAPTVEYSLDGTSWNAVTTSSTLPTATETWATGIKHSLPTIATKSIFVRITNNTSGKVMVDDIAITANPVFADSMVVKGAGDVSAINVKGGTLQMVDTIFPLNAAQNVIWSLENGTGKAEISSTGLLTALKNGTVVVKARALDTWGTVKAEKIITLSNQLYPVTAIQITAPDSLKTDNEAVDFKVEVFPTDADTTGYSLSLTDSAGNASNNAIIVDGKLKAVKNGYVILVAKADDYMGVTTKKTIILTGQNFVPCTSVEVIGDTVITESGASITLTAKVLPDTADFKNVEFSLIQDGTKASLSADGVLKAIADGIVYVKASTLDGSNLADSLKVTITNQVGIDSIVISNDDTISVDNGTLSLSATVYPENASEKTVVWSVLGGASIKDTAYISSKNILNAVRNGKVTVKAVSVFNPEITAIKEITIVNQIVQLDSLQIATPNGVDGSISEIEGSLPTAVAFFPADADAMYKAVTYVVSNDKVAKVSSTGIVSGITNGTVYVKVYSNLNSAAKDSIAILVSNQASWKEFDVATKVDTTHISNKSDFSVKGKIAYDSKYIYLKLDVNDDFIYAPDNSYMNDNFEIYFDMNNGKIPAGKRGAPIWPTSYDGQEGYYQLRLIPAVPFDSVNTWAKGYAVQEYQKTNNGYRYEVKFSIDSLLNGYVPAVGKEIGFDILASDNDTTKGNEPYYRDQLSFYSPSATIWCDAAMWGTFKFAENGSFTQVFDVTKPSAVSNLKAKQDVKNVLLTWDAATDNIVVDKYIVYVDNAKVASEYAALTDNSYLIENVAPGAHTFSVAAVDVAGNESDKVEVSFTMVGVNNASMGALSIFPNPSADFISINNESTVKMEIFNAAGQIVIVKSVNAGEKVDISSLSNGIYSVRVLENNNVSVLKLIKK